MEISFSSVEQAKAVYDVVEHRVLTAPTEMDAISSLEQDETFELVAFLHRLYALIRTEEEE